LRLGGTEHTHAQCVHMDKSNAGKRRRRWLLLLLPLLLPLLRY
jgi:hypothetical protein